MLITNNVKFAAMSQSAKSQRDLWKQFGVWIKDQRETAKPKKTQDTVAKDAGISVVHLSRIENGQSGAKRDTVIAIAKAIPCDVNEALSRAGFGEGEPPSNEILDMPDLELSFLFNDSRNWSEENRREAFENAKWIFRRYKQK
jgi:transcriptional regulator with XRE-family HTH domain